MRVLSNVLASVLLIVSFSSAATHTVVTSGFTFSPNNLTVLAGDTVVFSIALMHNAMEVSQTTWNANDTTRLPGGFAVPFGGGSAVLTVTGTHYYICQAHASLAMKGIIVVNPTGPGSVTVENTVDQDGSIGTTGDRIAKPWGLRLYHNAVSPGNLVGAVSSGTSLTVDTLSPGSYIAVEDDSAGWQPAGVIVDGSTLAVATHQRTVSVSSGEEHTVAFLNTAPHVIISSGFTFSPDSIDVTTGDTVQFVLDPMHTAREVSSATWLADDTVSNGGFDLPSGGGTVSLTPIGTYYYVCVPHASIGMKGVIVVHPIDPATITVENVVDQDGSLATTADRAPKNWSLRLYADSVAPGNLVGTEPSGQSLTVGSLLPGTYIAVEDDSAGWYAGGVIVDGTPTGVPSHQRVLTVAAGEVHTITFVNTAPHIIFSSGFTFVPESIIVGSGDTVHFVLDPMHTAREVNGTTWLADDTTSNGGFDLPFGGGSAVLTGIGLHYYVCVPHASIGMKGKITVGSSVVRPIVSGWNMISVPVGVTDFHKSVLFPTAISDAFAYQGVYQSQSVLANGLGYWLNFGNSQLTTISGFPIAHDTIQAQKGWNLIGSLSSPIPTSSVGTDPTGIITSGFFAYNSGYTLADTIAPGYGYWVKLTQQGSLHLDSGAAAAEQKKGRFDPSLRRGSRLTFADAAGRTQTLYFSPRPVEARAELPPLPPAGAFDVRFAGNSLVCSPGSDGRLHCPVEISGALFPVTVTWDLPPARQGYFFQIDREQIPLTGKQTVAVSGPEQILSLSANDAGDLPREFSLGPAFPNPFNPLTTIEYQLPVESRITLRLYTLLGQLQTVLADGIQQAGLHTVTWNAEHHASGVYLVRFQASSLDNPAWTFERVEKIVLQK